MWQGDARKKLTELLRLYPWALGVAKGICRSSRNSIDAEDVVQMAMFKATKNFHQFTKPRGRNPESALRAWLSTIIRNEFINCFRKQSKAPWPLPEDDFFQIPAACDHSLEVDSLGSVLENLDESVAQAVSQMNPSFLEVLKLYIMRGLSTQEIAEVLGIPVGTVLSRLHRAKAFLRGELGASTE